MDRKIALITGASGGLGVAFAHELAARGYDIVLTARSEAPMQEVADELTQKHGSVVTIIPLDLSVPGSAGELVRQLDERAIAPDVLVNNAAFGLHGTFVDLDLERLTSMLQLNMASLAELTLLLGGRMRAVGRGHILMVSSGAAYQPTPTMAAYGATKAFIQSLGEALHVELSPQVGVTVVSPGPMDTGFNTVSGLTLSPGMQRMIVSIDEVAKIGLDALFAGKSGVVPGVMNRLGVFINRFLSRHAAAKMFARMAKGT